MQNKGLIENAELQRLRWFVIRQSVLATKTKVAKLTRILIATVVLAGSLCAQLATPMAYTKVQFLDGKGAPASGYRLCSYRSGTSALLGTYADSKGTAQNPNPVHLDAAGRASIWLGGNSYKLVLMSSGEDTNCASGTVIWTQDYVNSSALLSNTKIWSVDHIISKHSTIDGSATLHATSAETPNSVHSADQFGGFTDAAIQAAIDAAPNGGTVFLPSGVYEACRHLPITVTKSLKIVGAGWGTDLQVCATVGKTTDVFQVIPPPEGILYGNVFEGFQISVVSGTPGRYGINFDGLHNSAYMAQINGVKISSLGSCLIHGSGSGKGNGIPHVTRIQDSQLTSYSNNCGAIHFDTAGDTLVIDHNKLEGNGYALDVAFQSGSSSLVFMNNNVTAWKGVHVGGNAVAIKFENNEFETTANFTGSNGAVLDIDGTSRSRAAGTLIGGNSFQIVNGIAADSIRLNFADNSIINGNYFVRGARGSCDIKITPNARGSRVETNIWTSGPPYVCDEGTSTSIGTITPDTFFSSTGVLPGNAVAPACNATHRGVFWYQPGPAGVKDVVQVCAKDAADTFSWRTIY